MSERTEKRGPVAMVGQRERDGYFHVDVVVDPGDSEHELANLVVTCQAHVEDDGSRKPPYAFEVRYQDVYAIRLEDARRMARVLGRIDRGLGRLRARYGSPEDFAAFVMRVADVLKIRSFRRDARDGGVVDMDAEGAHYHIRRLVADWLEAAEEAQPATA